MTRSRGSRTARVLNRLAVLERMIPAAPTPVRPTPAGRAPPVRRKRNRGTPPRLPAGNLNSRRCSGVDHLVSVTLTAKELVAGKGLFQAILNPRNFKGTRLYQESLLWNRWRPLSMRFNLSSGAPSVIGGEFVVAWTSDPTETWTNDNLTTRLYALSPTRHGQLNQQVSISVPSGLQNASHRWYSLSGPDVSETSHGAVVAAVSSPTVAADTAKITFHLSVNWSCEFSSPDVPPVKGSVDTDAYPVEGYEYMFTTSVSDWAEGTALSLKSHSGGGLVPFVNLQPGVVYQFANPTLIKYKKEKADKSLEDGYITHGVRIHDYYVPAMAVFPSEETAKAYIASGYEVAKATVYKGAGDKVYAELPWSPLTSTVGFAVRFDGATRPRWTPQLIPPPVPSTAPSTRRSSVVELGEDIARLIVD